MSWASEIELAYLRYLWSHQSDRRYDTICPNCLARREGSVIDTPHASWCARAREVKALEQNESEYLIQI